MLFTTMLEENHHQEISFRNIHMIVMATVMIKIPWFMRHMAGETYLLTNLKVSYRVMKMRQHVYPEEPQNLKEIEKWPQNGKL